MAASAKTNSDNVGSEGDSTKKFADVSKPGATPAHATSRPIIVNNREIMRDPMMSEGNAASEEKSQVPEERPITVKSKVIQPDPNSELTSTSQKSESRDMEAAETTEAQPPKRSVEEAAVDAYADKMLRSKKKPSKEDEQRDAEIEKHIAEKTFYVPIGQVKKRRNKRRFIIISLIVLLGVAVVFLLDAEIIDTGIELPIDLI